MNTVYLQAHDSFCAVAVVALLSCTRYLSATTQLLFCCLCTALIAKYSIHDTAPYLTPVFQQTFSTQLSKCSSLSLCSGHCEYLVMGEEANVEISSEQELKHG